MKRRRNGKQKYAVAVDCPFCGNQWYSTHPDAVEQSRKADKNINRRHGIK